MQETSQGSVEPVKEHCWQIWYSIFWQIRPSCSVRNTLCLVQFGGRPYKSDRCGHNSEWKKILTSSPGTLAYGVIDLGVFLPLVIHLPSEKLILPKFSSLRGVAILDCDSHSQAGLTSTLWVLTSISCINSRCSDTMGWVKKLVLLFLQNNPW